MASDSNPETKTAPPGVGPGWGPRTPRLGADAIHAELVRIGADVGLPKRFGADLITHDLAALRYAAGTHGGTVPPFAWCVGESGTHLMWVDAPHGARYSRVELADSIAECLDSGVWATWDGVSIQRRTLAEVRDWLLSQNQEGK